MMMKPKLAVVTALAVLALGLVAPVARADMTNDQVQQMLDELKGIRTALEKLNLQGAGQQAAAPQDPVSDKVSMQMPTGARTLGRKDAPLVMVEYTDLQCPFCQQFHNTVYDDLKKNYIDTGKILFVSRDFPLDFHPWARPAAIAARCAGDQNKYWEVRNTLQSNADKLSKEMITQTASTFGLDMKKFAACQDSDMYTADINKQIAEGTAAGISGTPSFVVGRVTDGKLDGVRIVGAMPYAQFDSQLKDMLAASATK